jgi:hypothetical protein
VKAGAGDRFAESHAKVTPTNATLARSEASKSDGENEPLAPTRSSPCRKMVGGKRPFADIAIFRVGSVGLSSEVNPAMRGRMATGLAFVAVASSFLVLGSHPEAIVGFYHETLPPMMFTLWLSAFVVATLSPPTIAFIFWRGAKRPIVGWIFHVLLVPAIYIVTVGCLQLMEFAADEIDSLSEWAILPAVFLLILCSIVYFVALGARNMSRFRQSANGG